MFLVRCSSSPSPCLHHSVQSYSYEKQNTNCDGLTVASKARTRIRMVSCIRERKTRPVGLRQLAEPPRPRASSWDTKSQTLLINVFSMHRPRPVQLRRYESVIPFLPSLTYSTVDMLPWMSNCTNWSSSSAHVSRFCAICSQSCPRERPREGPAVHQVQAILETRSI